MLAISSDSHDDNALFCLPLFFVRYWQFRLWATVVRDLGPALQLFRIESERLCRFNSVGGSFQGARIHTLRSSSVGTDQPYISHRPSTSNMPANGLPRPCVRKGAMPSHPTGRHRLTGNNLPFFAKSFPLQEA